MLRPPYPVVFFIISYSFYAVKKNALPEEQGAVSQRLDHWPAVSRSCYLVKTDQVARPGSLIGFQYALRIGKIKFHRKAAAHRYIPGCGNHLGMNARPTQSTIKTHHLLPRPECSNSILTHFSSSLRRINAYAAQTAFFMFLSIIPLVILLLSLFRHFGPSEAEVITLTNNLSPGIIDSFFEMYIDEITEDSKLSLTIVSGVILLWSASKGVFAIIGGLNSVYEIKETRNYFIVRLTAMLYTFAFLEFKTS